MKLDKLNRFKIIIPINIQVIENSKNSYTAQIDEPDCFALAGHGSTEYQAVDSLRAIVEVMFIELNKTDKNSGEWLALQNLLNRSITQ